MKTKVQYEKEEMLNEDGTWYGTEYFITGPEDVDFLELQEELINSVIGTDYYHSNRGVWEQVRIFDVRENKIGYHVTLKQKINLGMDCNIPSDCNLTDVQLEKLGFEVGESDNPLFIPVNLPDGWEVKRLEGGYYHFGIYDTDGFFRVGIYYPMTLPRDAYTYFKPRYRIEDDKEEDADGISRSVRARIIDRASNEVIKEFEVKDLSNFSVARAWMDQFYPEFENPVAYWNKETL